MSDSSKHKERENLYHALIEIETLNLDSDFKNIVIEEYKRSIIKTTKGIDIAPHKYLMIVKSKILDKYSNSDIKIASKFFRYNKRELSIEFSWVEVFLNAYHFVSSLVICAIGFGIFLYLIFSPVPTQKIWLLMGIAIITMLFGFYSLAIFVAPANVARMIQNDLKKKKKKRTRYKRKRSKSK